MNRLYLQAIRALPEAWVVDGLIVAAMDTKVLAVHPDQRAMIYTEADGWSPLDKGFRVVELPSESPALPAFSPALSA